MITIKKGEPQPIPCKKCKTVYGYKISQKIHIVRDNVFAPDGSENGCIYGESEYVAFEYKIPSCANCNSLLPFRLS